MEIGLYFQRPMYRSVAVLTGNSWGLRIRIRSASLEPLISGFLILADRFGLAISGDDRIIVCKTPLPDHGKGSSLVSVLFYFCCCCCRSLVSATTMFLSMRSVTLPSTSIRRVVSLISFTTP